MQPYEHHIHRGDIVTLSLERGGKVRPVLVLKRVPDNFGLLILTLSTTDFGGLGQPIRSDVFNRDTYASPQISVYYPSQSWTPRIIGALDPEQLEEVETVLMDFFFDHLLD